MGNLTFQIGAHFLGDNTKHVRVWGENGDKTPELVLTLPVYSKEFQSDRSATRSQLRKELNREDIFG